MEQKVGELPPTLASAIVVVATEYPWLQFQQSILYV